MTTPQFLQQQREHPEPEESGRPVPRLVLILIGGLLAWAMYYLYAHYTPMPSLVGDNRVAEDFTVAVSADGAQLYTANCVACHQANGNGLPGVFPPLANSEWVIARDPGVVTQIILHGVEGPLTVAGTTYSGIIPNFRDTFSDAEVAAVVNYLRTHFGNAATQTDAAHVAQVRAATEQRSTPWNGDEDLQPLLAQ